MPDETRKYKLTGKAKFKVLSLLAEGHNAQRVCNYLLEHYDIRVSRQNIHSNYATNPLYEKRIVNIKRIIDKNLAKHPLASKVNRLNWILEALNECFMWRTIKIYFDKHGNEIDKVCKRNIGAVASLIAKARREVEGQKGDNNPNAQVNLFEMIERLNGEHRVGAQDSIHSMVA
jgi:hypothetical protein